MDKEARRSSRAALQEEKGVHNVNRNERSRERSLLHGQDTGKTQDHGSSVEEGLAVGGGWRRLAAVDGWQLAVDGG